MRLFGGKSGEDNSSHQNSFWSKLTKPYRKQEQKCNSTTNLSADQKPTKKYQIKPPLIKITEDSRKDNFRLSLQSLKPRPHSNNSIGQIHNQYNRTTVLGTEQLDFRLRTSKLQCEQLKKKVATISLECQQLENQCKELKDVKEQLLLFQSDILMLKKKQKISTETHRRISYLEEENYAMREQIDSLRSKIAEIDREIDPGIIKKRLDQLESDSHHLTSITLQNRRDHDSFSLDVGNQLVETFITQQTIYEEFRRLQHRLVSVERQNQIMADLIHFHCHNPERGAMSEPMTNSDLSRGRMSCSFSPPSSERGTGKVNMSPSNFDWQLTDHGDSIFLCDTLNKSKTDADDLGESCYHQSKDYYKIHFSPDSESITNIHLTDLSIALTTSVLSGDDVNISWNNDFDIPSRAQQESYHSSGDRKESFSDANKDSQPHCHNEMVSGINSASLPKDDGYFSVSTNRTMMASFEECRRPVTVFQDDKERYLILPKHLQKSRGRSKRTFSFSNVEITLIVRFSMDLETHLSNRKLRQRQHKQRESNMASDNDDLRVFSDTELYGTRFCIDSDLDDEDIPKVSVPRISGNKRTTFSHMPSSKKLEQRHVSSLPPLIENVSERERKIEIRSKKSKLARSEMRPRSVATEHQSYIPMIKPKEKTNSVFISSPGKVLPSSAASKAVVDVKQTVNKKPPKCTNNVSKQFKHKIDFKSPRRVPVKSLNEKPPPIPPRPKKKVELYKRDVCVTDLASLEYVNDPPIRTSPEGCQDVQAYSFNQTNKPSSPNHLIQGNLSSVECNDSNLTCHDVDYEDFYDQDFVSELENYQLPRSTVNMLVLQHFK